MTQVDDRPPGRNSGGRPLDAGASWPAKLARGERRARRRRLIVAASAAGLVLVAVAVTALVLVEQDGGYDPLQPHR